jgi:hypothetical protein
MQDIRKPYSASRSNSTKTRDLNSRVEQFEKNLYQKEADDIEEEVHIPIHISSKSEKRAARDIHAKEIYPNDMGRRGGYGEIKSRDASSSSNKGTLLFIGATIVAIVGVGLMTFVFNSATVTIIPKHTDIDNLSKSFMFSMQEAPNSIAYELASTTITKSKKLPVSESKIVQAKASGKILVFNNFDENPQKLIKNTRFESAAGKIYRINQSITIPGKKGTTPGSVEVTVYADSNGPEYNSGPTDFTIPGFKGSPRYGMFYGRSNGALVGGAQGNVSLVSKSDLDSAKDEFALEINQTLKNALKDLNKTGYVALSGASKIVLEDNEKDVLVGVSSTYTVTATGYVPLVKEEVFARAVASTLREYNNEPVRVDYQDTLSFTAKDDSTIGTDKSTEILVEGKPRVVWLTDGSTLKKALLGKSKADFTATMSGFPSIDRASNSFSPMWLNSFPDKESSIEIKESLKTRIDQ